MSSPNLNLPMLSPYLLGDLMSSHDGVFCYPAIRRGTEEKYIVKVISIPASQSKLEALLLTGALSGKEAALEYFMTLSKDVISQTDILQKLSHQEGFVPYLDAKIQKMEGDVGYHVFLLGTYKQSLERIMRSDVMTHADVTNLGLDLCAALAACRRTGYLYVDLKPGNIFRDPEQGFRIGDVGFIALSSLKYASLPMKYRSSYTAPELLDDMAVVNSTVDIYALGLVLYQAYNGGVLPFEGNAPADVLPPPMYADYEMAEIILKACHPDPSQRWQDPTQMAHALIDYLQTYGAAEAPIIPPVLDKEEEAEAAEEDPFEPEADPQQLQQEMEDLENADPDELAFLSGLVNDDTAPNDENTADVPDDVMSEELSVMLAQADELIEHELPQPPVAPAPVFAPMPEPIVLTQEVPDAEPEQLESAEDVEEAIAVEEADGTQSIQEQAEHIPAEQADAEVIPAVQEDIPLDLSAALEAPAKPAKSVKPAKPAKKQAEAQEEEPKNSFVFPWRIAMAAVVVLLLIGGWFLGVQYYNQQYLVNVSGLVLQNDKDMLTVQVLSDAEDSLLTVVCTDSYGNSIKRPVVGGVATFTGLKAGTCYIVTVEANGNHKLSADVSDSFTTPAQTQILSFTAGIGPEDCSVALNFTVRGPDTDRWSVLCQADGVEDKTVDFTGRNVVITDLVAGKHYTFTLISPDDLYMSGNTQVDFVATNILYAQGLTITACGNGQLTAQWQQPAGATVTEWQVRCFNESGYNVTVTTSELGYTFTDVDHSTPCTVEVTAVGMNDCVSATISADPITVTDFSCVAANSGIIVVTWSYSGAAPVENWLLQYSIEGVEYTVSLQEPYAALMAIAGCKYQFTIQTADGKDVFNSTHSYQTESVDSFTNYGITAGNLTVMTVAPPENGDWNPDDVGPDSYKIVFHPGEQAGILLTSDLRPMASENSLLVEIVIYDSNGYAVTFFSNETVWDSLWRNTSCLLPVSHLPEATGEFMLQVFFDGAPVCWQSFTMAEAETEPAI